MANNLNLGGQVTLSAGPQKATFNLADSYTQTGSNFISLAANITTGSWGVLSQGSNSDFRYGFFANLDATSSCYVAVNSTASYAALLGPGDVAAIPGSGSAVLYAKASGANGTIVLQYLCIEA